MILEKTIGDTVEFIAKEPKIYLYTFLALAAIIVPAYASYKKHKEEKETLEWEARTGQSLYDWK
jgi:hypothetical protein